MVTSLRTMFGMPEENRFVFRMLGMGSSAGGLTAIILLLLLPIAAAAQEEDEEPRRGGAGFFTAGIQALPFDALGDALEAAGNPRPDERAFTLGGGGHRWFGRLRVGGEGHGLLMSVPSEGALRTDVSGGYGLFTIGYELLPAGRFALSPVLGLGRGGVSIEIDERDPFAFTDALNDPRRGVRLSRSAFLGSASVVLEGAFGGGAGRKAVMLGLETGYVFLLRERSWRHRGGSVVGGPEAAPAGPFFRLRIGRTTVPRQGTGGVRR